MLVFKGADGLLAFRGDQPVDEHHGLPIFHVFMFIGVDRHDAVLIEQHRVALQDHPHLQLILIFGGQPGTPVGEGVGPLLVGDPLGLLHALAHFHIPFLALGVYPRLFPDGQLLGVGAGLVPPGDKGRVAPGDLFEGLQGGFQTLDFGRVIRGADDDEVVIHDVVAVHKKPLFHRL
jgi:hypothetical protein